jgi:SAM-dependent methyltransferase
MGIELIREQYDEISVLYDILSDGDDGAIYFRMYIEKVLKTLPVGAKVLDCSCGTGDQAIWMARQGYRVSASDISEGMIDRAREKAKNENLDISFFRSSWEELTDKTNDKYDLVVCPGNSLSHIISLEMLENSTRVIKEILTDEGQFFFDLRDWEKTFEDKSLPDQEFQVKSQAGLFDVRYSYEINGWNVPCVMYVDVRPAGEKAYTQFVFEFFPFGYQQIHDILLRAGFKSLERESFPDGDYYFAVAK